MNIAAIFAGIGKLKEVRGKYREYRRARKPGKIRDSLEWKMNHDGLSKAEAVAWVSKKYNVPEEVLLRDYFEDEESEDGET